MLTKKVAAVFVVGLAAALSSLAQADQPTSAPAGRARRTATTQTMPTQRTMVRMDLTDQQKAQVKAILAKAREDADATTDKNAKQAIFRAANEKIRQTVMTDEQRAKVTQANVQRDRRKKATSQPASRPASQPASQPASK